MSVISLDQLLNESSIYINISSDYLTLSSIKHEHPVLVQLPTSRAIVSNHVMKILTIDSDFRLFEEQVAAYTEAKVPSTGVVQSEKHIHTSFDASTCKWFDECNVHMDYTKMPLSGILNNNEFNCVPIIAIHGINLSNAIRVIDYEIIQVKYISFRPPVLPDLSKPLFI
jgi:hypothetical protein